MVQQWNMRNYLRKNMFLERKGGKKKERSKRQDILSRHVGGCPILIFSLHIFPFISKNDIRKQFVSLQGHFLRDI